MAFAVRDSTPYNVSIKSMKSSLISDVSTPVVLVAVFAKCSLRVSTLHVKSWLCTKNGVRLQPRSQEEAGWSKAQASGLRIKRSGPL